MLYYFFKRETKKGTSILLGLILGVILSEIYYIKYWFSFFVIKGSKNIKKAKAYINSEDDNDLKNLFNKISK